MKNIFHYILIFPLVISCSSVIKLYGPKKEDFVLPEKPNRVFCTERKKEEIIIAGQNEKGVQDFKSFLNSPQVKVFKLSKVEIFVLYALIQTNYRPDLSSPTSSLQVLINLKGVPQYWEFGHSPQRVKNIRPKPEIGPPEKVVAAFPFFYGLTTLLKKHKSKRGLSFLARLLDRHYNYPITIGKSFSRFLQEQSSRLSQWTTFKNAFFRGNQILRPNETLPKVKIESIVRRFQKEQKYQKNPLKNYFLSNHLFKLSSEELPNSSKKKGPHFFSKIHCNFDFRLYKNSIFLITAEKGNNNPFGIDFGGGNHILAVSGQNLEKISPFGHSFLVNTQDVSPPSVFCIMGNSSEDQHLTLISLNDRDPGQHLYHLLLYGLPRSSSLREVNTFINHPRHLFLVDPLRMIYESTRGGQKQLEHFLGKGIPIYHSSDLGQIWAHGSFFHLKESGFVLDERRSGHLSCH